MSRAFEALWLAGREAKADQGRVLFIGARAGGPCPEKLCQWTLVQPLRNYALPLLAQGFELVTTPQGVFDAVWLLPGKARLEIHAQFALAQSLLKPEGVLVMALENDCGAARYEKQLGKFASERLASVSKYHCRGFALRGPWQSVALAPWLACNEPKRIDDTCFFTVPGVFSADGIDPGSAFLCAHLPRTLRGRVADFGAGWGYLSHHVLSSCPAVEQVCLIENDARALSCASLNLAQFSSSGRTEFSWSDVTQENLGRERFDSIVMNPPFHLGRETVPELGYGFLQAAVPALKAGGELWLVANRQLPYEGMLYERGLVARQIAQEATYKVLHAIAPRSMRQRPQALTKGDSTNSGS